MAHYLLIYELADDYLERRPEFRGLHLEHAWAAQARGELVLAGALAEPADQAVLLRVGVTNKEEYAALSDVWDAARLALETAAAALEGHQAMHHCSE